MPNHYDKIFKENFEALMPYLLKIVLDLDMPKVVTLKDKLQTTVEREADNFKKVVHEDPTKDYGLHWEIQSHDEDMRRRNLVYYALFYNTYGIPLRQIVVYIGPAKPKHILNTKLELGNLIFAFDVVDLRSIKKDVFLQSDQPECVLLALLADFGSEKPEMVVRQILRNLERLSESKNALKKYQKQLLVLSRLRDLTVTTTKLINEMPVHFELEKDILYMDGLEKGIEKGIEKGLAKGIEKGIEKGVDLGSDKTLSVVKLLMEGGHSMEQICKKAEVAPEFVVRVANKLGLALPK